MRIGGTSGVKKGVIEGKDKGEGNQNDNQCNEEWIKIVAFKDHYSYFNFVNNKFRCEA